MHRHTEEHPTRNEEEYFARENAELIKQMRARLDEERSTQERRQHFMKCPRCGADLNEREFESVKVDVCSECHGVWFDQGELDVMRLMHKSPGPIGRIMSDILDLFQHNKPRDSTGTSR